MPTRVAINGFGRFGHEVAVDDGDLVVASRRIAVLAGTEAADLPWSELGAEVVIESTGRFRTRAAASRHLDAGARKLIRSAPAKGDEPADADVVLGVNFDASTALFEARRCLSCGSCFACDNCFGVCPDNAVIKLDPPGAYAYAIDLDYCKGCGIYVQECPAGAIEMSPEEVRP